MRLWIDSGSANSPGRVAGATIKGVVEETIEKVGHQVLSRATRGVNALRNAELNVLKGQRSGKVYRKPYTKSATYRASAPGEPPARRTGNLRLHWNGNVKTESVSSGVRVYIQLESQEEYASILEKGTSKMAPRPFVGAIIEKAEPDIRKIYDEPYT